MDIAAGSFPGLRHDAAAAIQDGEYRIDADIPPAARTIGNGGSDTGVIPQQQQFINVNIYIACIGKYRFDANCSLVLDTEAVIRYHMNVA